MAAASTFSYAQAAKGQGTPPAQATNAATAPSESAPSVSTDDKSTQSIMSSTDVPDAVPASDIASSVGEKTGPSSVTDSESNARTEIAPEKVPEKKEEEVSRLDRPWRRNEKDTRSSSTNTRSNDDQETRKPRKGKKGKSSDRPARDSSSAESKAKETEPEPEVPEVQLSEAPLPSVNIWQQRKEQLAGSQQAKKPADDSTTHVPSVNGAYHASQATDSATRNAPSVQGNGVKKAVDATRPERNGPRGSRAAGKEREGRMEMPPSVADATSWPSVETAVQVVGHEEKRKTGDKLDQPDVKEAQDDASQSKPRQKTEWVAYNYVPSVSFETVLPQLRGSKPRGGAKGSSSTRTNPGPSAVDKAPVPSSSSSKVETASRPRESIANASRATTTPPTQKRAPVEGTHARPEQKKSSGNAGAEKPKDAQPVNHTEHSHNSREGRSDRGRGGFRGRGGHHAANSHAQHQHASSSVSASVFTPSQHRLTSPYSPPPRGGHNQGFVPQMQRGRGARNGGHGYNRMSLPNGATRPPPVQTQYPAPSFDYGVQPMSAMGFPSPTYWNNGVVMNLLRSQIEYYFSIENLCKDMFLRKHMDSQGFVHLHFISAFKRMRELSPDIGAIRLVCEASDVIDFVVGDDDCERIRRRDMWQAWILPVEDRDALARNDGPRNFSFKSRAYQPFAHQLSGFTTSMGGIVNGHTYHGATQLSAEVPDFSPSQPLSSEQPRINGHGTAPTANGDASAEHIES